MNIEDKIKKLLKFLETLKKCCKGDTAGEKVKKLYLIDNIDFVNKKVKVKNVNGFEEFIELHSDIKGLSDVWCMGSQTFLEVRGLCKDR